jgi:hypothetical protein
MSVTFLDSGCRARKFRLSATMPESDLISPIYQTRFIRQGVQPFSRCIQRMEWHPFHSVWPSFAKPTFKPRNLLFGANRDRADCGKPGSFDRREFV